MIKILEEKEKKQRKTHAFNRIRLNIQYERGSGNKFKFEKY